MSEDPPPRSVHFPRKIRPTLSRDGEKFDGVIFRTFHGLDASQADTKLLCTVAEYSRPKEHVEGLRLLSNLYVVDEERI